MNDKINLTPHDDPEAAQADIEIVAVWEIPSPVRSKPSPFIIKALCIIRVSGLESRKQWEMYLERCMMLGMNKHYASRKMELSQSKFDVIAPKDDSWYVSAQYGVKHLEQPK
jgi:hypothetical protein